MYRLLCRQYILQLVTYILYKHHENDEKTEKNVYTAEAEEGEGGNGLSQGAISSCQFSLKHVQMYIT